MAGVAGASPEEFKGGAADVSIGEFPQTLVEGVVAGGVLELVEVSKGFIDDRALIGFMEVGTPIGFPIGGVMEDKEFMGFMELPIGFPKPPPMWFPGPGPIGPAPIKLLKPAPTGCPGPTFIGFMGPAPMGFPLPGPEARGSIDDKGPI